MWPHTSFHGKARRIRYIAFFQYYHDECYSRRRKIIHLKSESKKKCKREETPGSHIYHKIFLFSIFLIFRWFFLLFYFLFFCFIFFFFFFVSFNHHAKKMIKRKIRSSMKKKLVTVCLFSILRKWFITTFFFFLLYWWWFW